MRFRDPLPVDLASSARMASAHSAPAPSAPAPSAPAPSAPAPWLLAVGSDRMNGIRLGGSPVNGSEVALGSPPVVNRDGSTCTPVQLELFGSSNGIEPGRAEQISISGTQPAKSRDEHRHVPSRLTRPRHGVKRRLVKSRKVMRRIAAPPSSSSVLETDGLELAGYGVAVVRCSDSTTGRQAVTNHVQAVAGRDRRALHSVPSPSGSLSTALSYGFVAVALACTFLV